MSQQTGDDKAEHGRRHALHVHNEDNGANYTIPAEGTETIETIVSTLYTEKIKAARKPDDRLRCEKGGEDVFQFTSLTLDAYLSAGHCPELRWLFAAGTGGA